MTEFRRGLHYWADLTATYGDIVTDESTLKAYRDAGVKRVKWHTVLDGKRMRNLQGTGRKDIPINSIPPKPHRKWRVLDGGCEMKFCFGDIVVVDGNQSGVIVKSWERSLQDLPESHDVYVRSYNAIANYPENEN